MPSGKKKRLSAKRKKQGSPATDGNSDRETEALSVTGSVDVDDLESGVDTPTAKVTSRPASLDKEALSSQTDEWVRVSDFDVGTPTSQTEENDPSTEDRDTGSSRRSLDKLAEWETVSGEHIPGRQGSIHSVEEEPSECEAASAHSSESFTNLPSPHVAGRDKDGDSSDSDVKNRLTKRSSYCSSSSRSTEVKRGPASAETFDLSGSVDIREEVSSPPHLPSLHAAGDGRVEETGRLNIDSVAEKIVPGTAPETPVSVDSDETKVVVDDTTTPSEETIIRAPDSDEQCEKGETLGTEGPVLTEAIPEEESHKQVREEVPTASSESGLAATNPAEQETVSANGKDVSAVGPILSTPVPVEESPQEEKEDLPDADESLTQGSISGEGRLSTSADPESGVEESAIVASQVDGEDKVDTGGKIANPTIGESPATDDEEVASTSADVGDEKNMDGQRSEVSNFEGKSSFDPQELAAESLSVKAVPTSETSEHRGLSEEVHHSLATPVEKNGTEKRLIEAKSSSGCCGVLYWLLGWDN